MQPADQVAVEKLDRGLGVEVLEVEDECPGDAIRRLPGVHDPAESLRDVERGEIEVCQPEGGRA